MAANIPLSHIPHVDMNAGTEEDHVCMSTALPDCVPISLEFIVRTVNNII